MVDRFDAIEKTLRDHAQRLGDVESQQRRQKSDIERSVGDMTAAAIVHIEAVSARSAKRIEDMSAAIQSAASIGESTLALNKTQSATLEDVKAELEDARKIRASKAAADDYAKAMKDQEEIAAARSERETKKRLGIVALIGAITAPLIYLVGAAYASQRHEAPERPETHEVHEK